MYERILYSLYWCGDQVCVPVDVMNPRDYARSCANKCKNSNRPLYIYTRGRERNARPHRLVHAASTLGFLRSEREVFRGYMFDEDISVAADG